MPYGYRLTIDGVLCEDAEVGALAQRLALLGQRHAESGPPAVTALLSECAERTPAAYVARDGRQIVADSRDIQRADWLLEHRFHECFGSPTEAEPHWDDDEFEVPPGRPPYGDGFVPLGMRKTWQRVDAPIDELRRAPCRLADSAEPWQSCTDQITWVEHIAQVLRLDHLREGPRTHRFEFRDADAFAALLADQRAAIRASYAGFFPEVARLLHADAPRLYVGAHALWDRYIEDWLARDHVALAAGERSLLLIFRVFPRYYG